MAFTLKQARILSGLTQEQVAQELKVHRQTYMRWERKPDDMPVGKAKKASALFGRGVDEIFFTPESTLSR